MCQAQPVVDKGKVRLVLCGKLLLHDFLQYQKKNVEKAKKGSFTQVLHCVSLHGTALCQFARYCTVSVCTALHRGSLHGTALWQFARHSVLQRHYINAPYTGFHPQRGKGVYQSMHALNHSMSLCRFL